MLKSISIVVLSFCLFACATIKVRIPPKELIETVRGILNETSDHSGYLDLFTMAKIFDARLAVEVPPGIIFSFKIRKDDKKSQWQELAYKGSTSFWVRRFSLPAGDYILRVEAGDQMKDFNIRINSRKFTQFYFKAAMKQMEGLKFQGETTTDIQSASGLVRLSVPVVLEYEVFKPLGRDEDELLQTLLDPNWRRRAYTMILLGQYGTKSSVPTLTLFRDDAVVGILAKRAISKISLMK